MTHYIEDDAQKFNRIASERHLDLNHLMQEHFTGGGELNEARGRLLTLFLFEKPYVLAYEYRKKSSGYKKDKPILVVLIHEGLIRQAEKTRKTITFEYIGELPEGK